MEDASRTVPIAFPEALPISARVRDIAAAIEAHPVVIVAGATGSGKTTQLPKIALALGRGAERRIGVTQPRRIAATSVAARVAEELGCPLGREVGYQVRFDDRTSPETYVKFMTDGILLAEIQGDRLLKSYDTIILDEAHERSLTIDFLLGWLKRILPERPDLKVIVSSATLEHQRFSDYFGGAPVVEVEGRTYPVEVLYEPPDQDADMAEAVAGAVANVTSLDPRGDILVFLPGEREIRECEQALVARKLRRTFILPLYARLAAREQQRVFTEIPERRIILATNVAETSLTLPGIVYVIDTGVARLSRYDPRSGTTRLQIEGISQASADQRKGRCGRVREGICIRLYDEQSFAARPRYTDPEIKRTGLSGVILRMKSYGLGQVEDFPFVDAPNARAIGEGYRVLEELGALTDAPHGRELTDIGRMLARFPTDPRIGRMILAGAELGCLAEVLVVTAALNVQDPRERPRNPAEQQKADQAHRQFRDERSDFVGLLRLWRFVKAAESKGMSNLRRVCKDNYLHFLRIREWGEVHRQLEEVARELGEAPAKSGGEKSQGLRSGPRSYRPSGDGPSSGGGAASEGTSDKLHSALLSGLLSKVGQWNSEQRAYFGSKQTRFVLHPSSALAKKPPQWVMAFELVETSQLFARMVARVEPEWLLERGGHLLKRTYGEPHWSEKSGRASVKEHSTLYGLTVAKDRSVDYAAVAPERARRMFIDHALVRGEYTSRGAFQARNRARMAEVAKVRDKARKSEMLRSDDVLFALFDARVPAEVVNGKTFEAWREVAERADPAVLDLTVADLLAAEDNLRAEDYPDEICLHGTPVPLTYRFDPSADDDGVTLSVPLLLVPQLEPGELEWAVPGWMREKIFLLLDALPKSVRRELGPTGALADELHRDLDARARPWIDSFRSALVSAVAERTGVSVDPDALRLHHLPPYLRAFVRIVDGSGKVIDEGRDVEALLDRHGARARAAWKAEVTAPAWERTELKAWPTGASSNGGVGRGGSGSGGSARGAAGDPMGGDPLGSSAGELPPFVERRAKGVGTVRSYPALVDRGQWVDLVLMESEEAAAVAMRGGVHRLVQIAARQALSVVVARAPRPFALAGGSMLSRADGEKFRDAFVACVVDDAFELRAVPGAPPLPRSAREFEARLRAGLPRIDGTFRAWEKAIAQASAELDALTKTMSSAARHPSGQLVVSEVRAQLGHLFPDDVLRVVSLDRWAHYPRYLRAAQRRIERALADPRKDLDKLAPFTKLWTSFVEKLPSLRDKQGAALLRWQFEELRVAIFAPELRTPAPVSVASVTAALGALR